MSSWPWSRCRCSSRQAWRRGSTASWWSPPAIAATRWLEARGDAGVEGRSGRQLTEAEKAERATWVVENDGSLEDLEAKLGEMWHELVGGGGAVTATRRGRLVRFGLIVARDRGVIALVLSRIDFGETIKEVTLPLRHEDIIRQQAERHDIDAALIAAIINQESGSSTRHRRRARGA